MHHATAGDRPPHPVSPSARGIVLGEIPGGIGSRGQRQPRTCHERVGGHQLARGIGHVPGRGAEIAASQEEDGS